MAGNGADLAFEGVIARCASFAVVCQAAPAQLMTRRTNNATRGGGYRAPRCSRGSIDCRTEEMIAFLRAWCLVELNAAAFATSW